VSDAIFLNKENLEGDKQADLSVHGGIDKAVNAYPVEHYQYWNQRTGLTLRKRIPLPSPFNGSFGENFTVSGLLENAVCIGDIYEVGDVIIQISQPRQPCWKLARKLNQPKLPFWVQKTGKTGWYFRTLQEGKVKSLDAFKLTERMNPNWTIEHCNQLMYSKNKNKSEVHSILDCKELSESWRKTFKSFL
jgi:MOSC domain-containing protein YiiM